MTAAVLGRRRHGGDRCRRQQALELDELERVEQRRGDAAIGTGHADADADDRDRRRAPAARIDIRARHLPVEGKRASIRRVPPVVDREHRRARQHGDGERLERVRSADIATHSRLEWQHGVEHAQLVVLARSDDEKLADLHHVAQAEQLRRRSDRRRLAAHRCGQQRERDDDPSH